MVVSIIGVGLIGGSLAIALRQKGIATRLIGVESNPQHAQKALELQLIDEVADLDRAILRSDLVVFAVPVDASEELLPRVMDLVGTQVVMDMGSIKGRVLEAIEGHPARPRFVASHPMWGTEYSGPAAAVSGAFAGKAAVICDREWSDPDALALVENLYEQLQMKLLYMSAQEHDLHVAYVSHISHITSFALANTVLEKEKEEDKIFSLASGGFESTVRLAKSNPDMWIPIFMQNRENVLDVLNEHISQLKKFKSSLEKENYQFLRDLIVKANGIRKIIE